MSKLETPTKPLGVGRGHSFSSVSSSAKPASKVGIKSDNTTNNGATVDDAKVVRKKSVKALEVDTLKRRKLALSRDQVKLARVSPASRNDVKKRESISPEKSMAKKVVVNSTASKSSKTAASTVSKTKVTNKLNFVNSNKVTRSAVAGPGRKLPLKTEPPVELLLSEDQDKKSNTSKIKVNISNTPNFLFTSSYFTF